MKNMSYLCEVSDEDCRDQLRMDRATFHKLCFILQSVCGLKSSRRVGVPEKVVMFLSILAHHTKNRCAKFAFKRPEQTVSKHFHAVLNSVLRLHAMFLDADRVKFARGHRSWSKIEEDALIVSLTNVVLEGWKSDNGFKAGFQLELEKGMRKIIPGTDIVANPHINSKIHV
ncbi:hypothetical protein ACS0TY_021095 [Phlomoides rotata]